MKLPYNIIDMILLKLDNVYISIKLKRDFVIKKLCELNDYDIDHAAEEGWFNVVKFLYSIGTPCTSRVLALASSNGSLEMVKFLYENGVHMMILQYQQQAMVATLKL
jgi:hypothetical protein